MQTLTKRRLLAAILLFLIVPIGFYTKFYAGFGSEWVNNKLGGVFYEIFWCLGFYILLPQIKPVKIVLWIFIITCILEFIQLSSAAYLEIIRSNFIGQTIIGNSFSWNDFPYYVIGSALGLLILTIINRVR